MIYKAVLFDLDGTLLDTLDDLADSMNSVLEASGLPTHIRDKYKYFVGNGMRNLVIRALPESMRDDATITVHLDRMQKEYGKNCDVKTKPYEGVTELLEKLQALDMRLAVLSNKPDELTRLTISKYFSGHHFDMVFGERAGIPRKPDPSSALEISALMGIPPAHFIYLGDTGVDMKTAILAGMYAIGALWGFRQAEEMLENGANALIEKPLDLLRYLVL